MFVKHAGNKADTSKKSLLDPKQDSAIRKALMDPMVMVTPDEAVASPGSGAPAVSRPPQKQPSKAAQNQSSPTNLVG